MDERRSALLIATARYGDDQLKRLRSPARDARILCDVLADADIGAFDTTLLTDRPSYEVREQIEGFFADRAPEELLLLYFSCHGVTDTDGRLYFATTDTRRQRFRATAVEAAFVQDCVHGCRSRRIVLILDCCHSGAFPAGMTPKGSEHTAPVRAQLEGRGRAVLTSSDALEYAFEVDGDRVEGTGVGSAFTNALVEGLRSGRADLDGDGLISVDELYEYTYNRVRESQPSQTPRAWIDVQGQLVIARSVQPPSAEGLPVGLQELIGSPFANARLAAVGELAALLQHRRRGIAAAARAALLQLGGDDSRSVQEAARAALEPAFDAAPAAGVVPQKVARDQAALAWSGIGGVVAAGIAEAGLLAALVAFLQPWLYSGSGPSGSSLTTTNDFGTWTQVAAVLAIAAVVGAVLAGAGAIVVAVRGWMSTVASGWHRLLAMTVLLACVGALASLLAIPPAGGGNFGDMALPYWIALTGVTVAGAAAGVQVIRGV